MPTPHDKGHFAGQTETTTRDFQRFLSFRYPRSRPSRNPEALVDNFERDLQAAERRFIYEIGRLGEA